MPYSIIYYSEAVQTAITSLRDTLAARYIVLTRRMLDFGPNLGEPHTKAFGNGLFELRLKGADGIARVFILHAGRTADRDAALLCEEDQQDTRARTASRRSADEGDPPCRPTMN